MPIEEPQGPAEQPSAPEPLPAASAEAGTPESVDAFRQRLQEEHERAERLLGNWQRAQADFVNLKRRTDQEKGEVARFANAMLVLNLLPVLDDLERALQAVPTPLSGLTWIDGVALIYRKLQMTLERQGVEEIRAEGEDFDPRYHEAVLEAPGDPGKVLQVVQKGYRLSDRVIRPAMVVVGKQAEPESTAPAEEAPSPEGPQEPQDEGQEP